MTDADLAAKPSTLEATVDLGEAGIAAVQAAVKRALATKPLHQEIAEGVGICLLLVAVALGCGALSVGLTILGAIAAFVFAAIAVGLAFVWMIALLAAAVRKVFASRPMGSTNG